MKNIKIIKSYLIGACVGFTSAVMVMSLLTLLWKGFYELNEWTLLKTFAITVVISLAFYITDFLTFSGPVTEFLVHFAEILLICQVMTSLLFPNYSFRLSGFLLSSAVLAVIYSVNCAVLNLEGSAAARKINAVLASRRAAQQEEETSGK